MSVIETLIVLVGLVAGYWLVSSVHARFWRIRNTKNQTNFGPDEDRNSKSRMREDSGEAGQSGGDLGTSDHWRKILGVEASASADDVKRAYRAMISQYHPDKVATMGKEIQELARKKTQEINDAYHGVMSHFKD